MAKCENLRFMENYYKIFWVEKNSNQSLNEFILNDLGYSDLVFMQSSKDLLNRLSNNYVKDNVIIIASEKLAFNVV